MKFQRNILKQPFSIFTVNTFLLMIFSTVPAQEVRWMRVGELQSPFNELGAEYEVEFNFAGTNSNYFSWPAQYDINQNLTRAKGLWMGCENFNDPSDGVLREVKVIGSGPTGAASPDVVFPIEIKLIGKYIHPTVLVDDALATILDNYDVLDEIDEMLPCDRMIVIKFNTSMGISVTKKVLAFSQSDQDNYFIYDYVFKNTGIYNAEGDVQSQTLENTWFYFFYRYALGGITVTQEYNDTWGSFETTWGENLIFHSFGEDPSASEFTNPSSPFYQLRGFYAWYGPSDQSPRPPYDEDWGCPKLDEPGAGTLGTAKYVGGLTLHADTSPDDQTDNLQQPGTTWYISPDIPITHTINPSQYNVSYMQDRWDAMTEGHPTPDQQHDVLVSDDYPINYVDDRRQAGGGTAIGQGFGPYNMEPGDSIHIVLAEGASGISWEKGREVGSNWLQWRDGTGQPTLINPDGTEETSDYNEYKRRWVVDAGRDSILKVYRNAMDNYNSGYNMPQAPPQPESFSVNGGGDKIQLEWSNNAQNHPNFDGYVIYRSRGEVLGWMTEYEKIFECNKDNVVHEFDDVTAVRGFDYYYYIQSKDDGTQTGTGEILYSSMFWTVTSVGTNLKRRFSDNLYEIRVVPNPYDSRARKFQFGEESQYDRIVFYGLPPICKLKIFTERGDLIWEKDHTNSTGDEIWDSKTSSGQIVVSGIYLLYVEVTEDTYATEDRIAWYDIYDDNLNLKYETGDLVHEAGDLIYKKGQSKYRKFVIIR